jgi:hypothetical protein
MALSDIQKQWAVGGGIIAIAGGLGYMMTRKPDHGERHHGHHGHGKHHGENARGEYGRHRRHHHG